MDIHNGRLTRIAIGAHCLIGTACVDIDGHADIDTVIIIEASGVEDSGLISRPEHGKGGFYRHDDPNPGCGVHVIDAAPDASWTMVAARPIYAMAAFSEHQSDPPSLWADIFIESSCPNESIAVNKITLTMSETEQWTTQNPPEVSLLVLGNPDGRPYPFNTDIPIRADGAHYAWATTPNEYQGYMRSILIDGPNPEPTIFRAMIALPQGMTGMLTVTLSELEWKDLTTETTITEIPNIIIDISPSEEMMHEAS